MRGLVFESGPQPKNPNTPKPDLATTLPRTPHCAPNPKRGRTPAQEGHAGEVKFFSKGVVVPGPGNVEEMPSRHPLAPLDAWILVFGEAALAAGLITA